MFFFIVFLRLAQDFSRSRIFQGAISSQLTTWGETRFFAVLQRRSRALPEHSSPDSELRWSSLRRKGVSERSSSGDQEARWSKFLSGKFCF
jgi:hypothetical protein